MSKYPKPNKGNNRGRRGPSKNYIRKNERIRAPEIRVIDPEGKQLGVMQPKKALMIAKELGLDLVEVSPTARPPVCRILDFGKYLYEQSKKQKESKSSSSSQKVKEIKLRVGIDTHDYMTKIRRAEDFLDKGNKLKITLQFRGREMEHKDLGIAKVKQSIEDLSHVGSADADPKLVGRNVSALMSPLPEAKRERKYTTRKTEVDHDEE
ncbi:MAG: translation initiation factor IF-3 [Opitutales bacterium]|nr:translation initiation factor IF-3 [Opitutales bacterium]